MAKNLLLLRLKIGGKTRLSQEPSALVLQVLWPDICRSQAAHRRNSEHPLLKRQSHRRGFGHGVRCVHEDCLPQTVEDLQGFSSHMPRASHSGLMDTTYWGRNFGVVIMKDSLSGEVLWYKFIDRHERLEDYWEGITYLNSLGHTILAIVADGFKGLRKMFPRYKFQLCQFHQVMTVKAKLTSRPKLEASRELLRLTLMLCHTDKESFVGALEAWHAKWEDFIGERTVSPDGKSHYTHKAVRSAYLSLKRNMPWLWTWYDHPELNIPNTNNALESLNSELKIKLNLHRGMSVERRKIFIQNLIKGHKPSR